MADYALPKYDIYRDWIRRARQDGCSWTFITYGRQQSEEELVHFLAMQTDNNFWEITAPEWIAIVKLQEDAERETSNRERAQVDAIIIDDGQDNILSIPTDSKSAWQLYKWHLKNSGFADETITRMEAKTHRILRRLNRDTADQHPIKGLVVGNVQSGKTANMGALMAMAADWGWNMFIILSGTIESLRIQTQRRLLGDLNQPGNIAWVGLEHLSPKVSLEQQAQYLRFDDSAKQRYFTVCLKNPTRLKNMIQWLQRDGKKTRQMRILIIDDEADQAGINTAKINAAERRAVNRLIVNMVGGKNAYGKPAIAPYRAMNYIGYTATPYASVLNESGSESLYPANFIATLDVSNEYFGPQQLFGVDGSERDGMTIVRTIPTSEPDDLGGVVSIHRGEKDVLPSSLESAICWFLCGAACFRIWGIRKAVSMLIHTSQLQINHDNIAKAIQKWFRPDNAEHIVAKCQEIWETETNMFNKTKLFQQYPEYGHIPAEICDYPVFGNLEGHLRVLCMPPEYIHLNDDREFVYHNSVHLCIDNCSYTHISDEGEHVRLAYPNDDNMPDLAPAFIVVGGATLSRGLTLEGLISTYFLRSISQADTLMQMGRWFGYRKRYELLPRIWLTDNTKKQFVFLSTLDQELREDIHQMEILNQSPKDYAPRVKNTPKASFIRITGKNRMQMAVNAEFDFTGTMSQTTLFDDSIDIQQHNLDLTRRFIDSLPEPITDIDNPNAGNGYIWKDIPFSSILDGILGPFQYQQRSRAFTDMESLAKWIKEVTSQGLLGSWNVRLASLESRETSKLFHTRHGDITMVNRSRKLATQIEGLIDIGVLRDPSDMVADIDLRNASPHVEEMLKNFKASNIRTIRHEAGMDTTPLLVIYCIDKNSSPRELGNTYRGPLRAPADIIGLCLCIPGGKPDRNYATKIHVKLDSLFDVDNETESIV